MALEREPAMGFLAGATTSTDVTEEERRRALGKAMDLNALHWLVATMGRNLERNRLERRRDHVARADPKTRDDEIKEEEAEILLKHLENEAAYMASRADVGDEEERQGAVEEVGAAEMPEGPGEAGEAETGGGRGRMEEAAQPQAQGTHWDIA
ncbi:unnamed protein product [Closterium sp. Naga37s-1]|nr:unnamed protein product [Closterium sp. Naga37s-1]